LISANFTTFSHFLWTTVSGTDNGAPSSQTVMQQSGNKFSGAIARTLKFLNHLGWLAKTMPEVSSDAL
jgi:hypothetical protein